MDKIVNDMIDINVQEQLTPNTIITRGHHLRFLQLPTRVDTYTFFSLLNYGMNLMMYIASTVVCMWHRVYVQWNYLHFWGKSKTIGRQQR